MTVFLNTVLVRQSQEFTVDFNRFNSDFNHFVYPIEIKGEIASSVAASLLMGPICVCVFLCVHVCVSVSVSVCLCVLCVHVRV